MTDHINDTSKVQLVESWVLLALIHQKSWEPRAQWTACWKVNTLESVLLNWHCWSKPCPHIWACFCFLPGHWSALGVFFAAWLAWDWLSAFIADWGLVNLVSFRDFLKLFCLPLGLKSLLLDGMLQPQRKLLHKTCLVARATGQSSTSCLSTEGSLRTKMLFIWLPNKTTESAEKWTVTS